MNRHEELGRLNITYVCLQVTKQGQASYAHVHEMIAGLEALGAHVRLFEPRHIEKYHAWTRLAEFIRTQLRVVFDKERPDALYMRAHFALFPLALWARLRRIPVVQEINGPHEDLFIAWPATRRFAAFFSWLARTQYRWANRVITVTEGLRDWAQAEARRSDITVVPNAANTDVFQPGAPRPSGMPDHYAVFVGALAQWQGIDTLLSAVRDPAWPEGIDLVIAGDGAMRSDVEDAASQNESVHYLGSRPYTEIPAIISSSIASLIPKNSIGDRSKTGLSPLKLYEALACSTPVVVTDFPGQAELVRETEAGIVIPERDPHALAKAVAALVGDRARASRMGRLGYEAVIANHSWKTRAHDTLEILENAISSHDRT